MKGWADKASTSTRKHILMLMDSVTRIVGLKQISRNTLSHAHYWFVLLQVWFIWPWSSHFRAAPIESSRYHGRAYVLWPNRNPWSPLVSQRIYPLQALHGCNLDTWSPIQICLTHAFASTHLTLFGCFDSTTLVRHHITLDTIKFCFWLFIAFRCSISTSSVLFGVSIIVSRSMRP